MAKALDRLYGFDGTVSPFCGNCPLMFFTGGTDVRDWNLGGSCCPARNVLVTIILTPS